MLSRCFFTVPDADFEASGSRYVRSAGDQAHDLGLTGGQSQRFEPFALSGQPSFAHHYGAGMAGLDGNEPRHQAAALHHGAQRSPQLQVLGRAALLLKVLEPTEHRRREHRSAGRGPKIAD